MKSSLERCHKQPPGCPTSPLKYYITRVYKSRTHLKDQVTSPAGAGQRCSCNEGVMLMNQTGSGCAHCTVQPCPAHQPLQHFGKCPPGSCGAAGTSMAGARRQVVCTWHPKGCECFWGGVAALLAACHPNNGFTFSSSRLCILHVAVPSVRGDNNTEPRAIVHRGKFLLQGLNITQQQLGSPQGEGFLQAGLAGARA